MVSGRKKYKNVMLEKSIWIPLLPIPSKFVYLHKLAAERMQFFQLYIGLFFSIVSDTLISCAAAVDSAFL